MTSKRRSLLTQSEIINYTPVKLAFNPCSLRELYRIEYSEAVKCIGFELWEAMVEALADYSAASEYEVDRVYAAGEVVVWRGSYRRATQETTNQPSLATDWENAPKFNSDLPCASVYEDVYCNFLGPYLAFTVLAIRYPYIVTQITDGGLEYSGRKYNQQDLANSKGLKQAIFRDRDEAFNVLDHYLRGEASSVDPCFKGYKGNEVADKLTCGCNDQSCNICSSGKEKIGRYRFG